MIIATTFAVGLHTDAFFVAFKLPNAFRRLTAEGAFTQAFVPVYNATRKQDGEQVALELRDQVCIWLMIALTVIVLVGVLAAPWLIKLLAPGFSEIDGKQQIATELLRITFPYILLISLVAFFGAILNSFGKFAAFAFAPSLLNISMIGAAIWLAPQLNEPIFALAIGVIIGGLAQLLWQVVALWRIKQLPRYTRPSLTEKIRKVIKLTSQGALGVSIGQISIIVSLIFASFLVEGSVTWLYFADRLMELPAGIIGAAIAVVALPTLSAKAAKNDVEGFNATMDWSLRITVLLALPAAVGLGLLALPLCATLFQHGSFTADDTMMTSRAVEAYALGVPALATVRLLAAGFNARLNVMTPVKTSAFSLLVVIGMNFVLVPFFQHVGLALSLAIGSTINFLLLSFLLLRRGGYTPLPGWLAFVSKILFACAVMAAVLLIHAAKTDWTLTTTFEKIWRLAFAIGSGAACYFLLLYLTGIRPNNLSLKPLAASS